VDNEHDTAHAQRGCQCRDTNDGQQAHEDLRE
jgi:hypothetical protein